MTQSGVAAFRLHEPGEALRKYCHTFYVIECGGADVDDIMPAYSPQVLLFVEGGASIRFATGRADRSSSVAIVSQIEEAARITIAAGTRILGASLTIPGWLALGAPSLDGFANRMVPAAEAIHSQLANRLDALRVSAASLDVIDEGLARQFGAILHDSLSPLPRSTEQFVDTVTDWLDSAFDPQLADLHARLGKSPRQVQRICRRLFGRPPSALAKRHRAVRAASLLAMDDASGSLKAEVMEAFYDQAHLIRDVRRFTGHTPAALVPGESSLSVQTLDPAANSTTHLFARMAAAASR